MSSDDCLVKWSSCTAYKQSNIYADFRLRISVHWNGLPEQIIEWHRHLHRSPMDIFEGRVVNKHMFPQLKMDLDGHHFCRQRFKASCCSLIQTFKNFKFNRLIDNTSTLARVMTWIWTDNTPLHGQMMNQLSCAYMRQCALNIFLDQHECYKSSCDLNDLNSETSSSQTSGSLEDARFMAIALQALYM